MRALVAQPRAARRATPDRAQHPIALGPVGEPAGLPTPLGRAADAQTAARTGAVRRIRPDLPSVLDHLDAPLKRAAIAAARRRTGRRCRHDDRIARSHGRMQARARPSRPERVAWRGPRRSTTGVEVRALARQRARPRARREPGRRGERADEPSPPPWSSRPEQLDRRAAPRLSAPERGRRRAGASLRARARPRRGAAIAW